MTRETALWDAWKASAEIYRQRIRAMDSRTVRDGEDASWCRAYAWEWRQFIRNLGRAQARRAAEAAAAEAVEYPNPRHIPKNRTVTLISREEAIAKKLTRYYTAEKCSRGHLAERITSTRTCVECHRQHQLSNKTMRGREARRLAKAQGKTRYFPRRNAACGGMSRERSVDQQGCCVTCHRENVVKSRTTRVIGDTMTAAIQTNELI